MTAYAAYPAENCTSGTFCHSTRTLKNVCGSVTSTIKATHHYLSHKERVGGILCEAFGTGRSELRLVFSTCAVLLGLATESFPKPTETFYVQNEDQVAKKRIHF